MSNTAALLGNLLNTNAQISYYTQMQTFWAAKYEGNAAKLEEQVKYEEKWESAYDSALYTTKDMSASGPGGKITVSEGCSDAQAQRYADIKVYQYDEDLSEELADLDVEYDTMQTMYDTLLEALRAEQDSEKTATQTAAQDTGLLGGQ